MEQNNLIWRTFSITNLNTYNHNHDIYLICYSNYISLFVRIVWTREVPSRARSPILKANKLFTPFKKLKIITQRNSKIKIYYRRSSKQFFSSTLSIWANFTIIFPWLVNWNLNCLHLLALTTHIRMLQLISYVSNWNNKYFKRKTTYLEISCRY